MSSWNCRDCTREGCKYSACVNGNKFDRKPDEYEGDYICPRCKTYNEIWKKRENTKKKDIVYCWHCGNKVQLH